MPTLLKDILRSMPDPIEFNKPDEQIAVMRVMALEYEEGEGEEEEEEEEEEEGRATKKRKRRG